MPFRVIAEDKVRSHRSPNPLFQQEFDSVQGCIYHLCNPTCGYNVYDLLDMEAEYLGSAGGLKRDSDVLQAVVLFRRKYTPSIQSLLERLLHASPAGSLLFTSDYQFGPSARRFKTPITLGQFWKLHDRMRLRMNSLYHIRRDASSG